jgi:hypothetical protein
MGLLRPVSDLDEGGVSAADYASRALFNALRWMDGASRLSAAVAAPRLPAWTADHPQTLPLNCRGLF